MTTASPDTAADLPVGEWTDVYPVGALGEDVLRKLQHEVGYTTSGGSPRARRTRAGRQRPR